MEKHPRPPLTYRVDELGEIVSEDKITRERAFRKGFEGLVPYSHMLLFRRDGKVLLPLRGEKALFPFTRIPLTAGGFLTTADAVVKDGKLRFDYETGAACEFNEELTPEVELLHPSSLSRLSSLCGVYDFRYLARTEFAPNIDSIPMVYMEIMSAIYEEERHGKLNPNNREIIGNEIAEEDWFTPQEIERYGFHSSMGIYGKRILEYIIWPFYEELRDKGDEPIREKKRIAN